MPHITYFTFIHALVVGLCLILSLPVSGMALLWYYGVMTVGSYLFRLFVISSADTIRESLRSRNVSNINQGITNLTNFVFGLDSGGFIRAVVLPTILLFAPVPHAVVAIMVSFEIVLYLYLTTKEKEFKKIVY